METNWKAMFSPATFCCLFMKINHLYEGVQLYLGDTHAVVNISSDYSRWNLTNLNHGAMYTVWMTSVGSLGEQSVVSNNVTAYTTASCKN